MPKNKRKLYIKIFLVWLIGLILLFWHVTSGGGFKKFEADMKESILKSRAEP